MDTIRAAALSREEEEEDFPGLHKRKAPAHKGPGLTALMLLNPLLQKPLELVYSRKFGIHAATGTDRRVMNRGSRSTGMGSPSSCMLSM